VRDGLLLSALRRWADQFSPKVEIVKPDALVLDVTGIAHLYSGEAEHIKAILNSLTDLNVNARCALADTPMGARAWARYRPRNHPFGSIIPVGQTLDACDSLPVDALETDATEALHLLGLRTIEALRNMSSAELARRFGLHLTDALDRLIGRRPEPLKAETPSRPFATRMTLPDPIGLIDDVLSILDRIAEPLMMRLEKGGLGALSFALTVTCPDTGEHRLSVGFSRPTREARALIRQMRPKIETLNLPFGAERFRLEAFGVQPIQSRQIHLGSGAEIEDAMERLVTVVGNRLGFDRIRRPAPSQSHRAERECVSEEIADNNTAPTWPAARPYRPLQIFEPEYVHILEPGRPPERFEWRRQAYRVCEAQGPERVAPQWWSDNPGRLSDYYSVVTEEGPKLWLRRLPLDADNEWSVAGVFA
jgi:protein ImuB